MRYRFVEQQRQSYPVERLCSMMQVSRSGFYAWRKRPPSDRAQQDSFLIQQIQDIHQHNRSIYGSPRIHAELKAQGVRCSRKRVARLMRLVGLTGKIKGNKKAKRTLPSVPPNNLLRSHGAVTKSDQVWFCDITYLHTQEGWLYLAVVIDAYSRRIVGWAMRERLTAALTVDAFKMAWQQRRPPPGLICHSDRGSQYTSTSFQAALTAASALPSRGCGALDNAFAESFFATLKTEQAAKYIPAKV